MLKDKLHDLPKAKSDMFWVSVTLGPAFALLGALLVIFGVRIVQNVNNDDDNYEKIND